MYCNYYHTWPSIFDHAPGTLSLPRMKLCILRAGWSQLTSATSFFCQIWSYVAPPSHWGTLGAFPSLIRRTASPCENIKDNIFSNYILSLSPTLLLYITIGLTYNNHTLDIRHINQSTCIHKHAMYSSADINEWKDLRCSSTHECMNMMASIYSQCIMPNLDTIARIPTG
jgi:hypothetical protein